MARPTNYNKTINFTAYATANPSNKYNAPDHDREFDNIATSLDETQAWLEGITRDDGALANGVVTPDSMSATTLALLASTAKPKGTWVTSTIYAYADVVERPGLSTYICLVAHTSGVFDTDRAAGKWMVFTSGADTDSAIAAHEAKTDPHPTYYNQTRGDIRYVQRSGTNGSALIPVGTTAQRDSSPSTGYLRGNTSTGLVEWWDSSAWVPLQAYDSLTAKLNVAQTFTATQRGAITPLTDAATIAVDLSLNNNSVVQLGGNRTLGVPTGLVAGSNQSGTITLLQDKTGSRTLAYSWPYVWAGGTAGTLSTAGASEDQLVLEVRSYNSATATITIATPGVVTMTAHGFYHGQRCQIATTGALPTGLAVSTTYFIEVIDANTFYLCTSLTNVAAGTRIDTSGSQSGVHTLTGCTIRLTLNKAWA